MISINTIGNYEYFSNDLNKFFKTFLMEFISDRNITSCKSTIKASITPLYTQCISRFSIKQKSPS